MDPGMLGSPVALVSGWTLTNYVPMEFTNYKNCKVWSWTMISKASEIKCRASTCCMKIFCTGQERSMQAIQTTQLGNLDKYKAFACLAQLKVIPWFVMSIHQTSTSSNLFLLSTTFGKPVQNIFIQHCITRWRYRYVAAHRLTKFDISFHDDKSAGSADQRGLACFDKEPPIPAVINVGFSWNPVWREKNLSYPDKSGTRGLAPFPRTLR